MPRRTSSYRVPAAVVALATVLSGLVGGVAHAEVATENGTVRSFDGTPIAYTLFTPSGASASNRVPVIFYTHGWGGSRATAATDSTVKLLTDNGYAVLTWDARGFGVSGGEANVDSQEYEVRDVQALITFAAAKEQILTDDAGSEETFPSDCAPGETPPCFTVIRTPPNDPRMGMYGGSYAGGIQLMTAAADPRVDAIAPQIAWNDLPQSLKPNGVLKLGWDTLLYGSGLAAAATAGLSAQQTGAYASQIHQSFVEGVALNDWSTATYNWFNAKSPKHYINGATLNDGRTLPGINVPALVIQGTSDTLFNLNQGIANFDQIAARVGTEKTKMIWYCGGHTIGSPATVSLQPSGAMVAQAPSCAAGDSSAVIRHRLVKWMDRWVKQDDAVDTGARIEYQMQDGKWVGTASLPTTTLTSVKSTTSALNTVAPTTGQATSGTAGGCIPKDGTSAFPGSGWAREQALYTVNSCPYPRADWVPIGTMTGPPPKGCGTPPAKPPCEPTFEQMKPGVRFVGAPKVHIRVTGTSPEAYLFFKLVDYNTKTKEAIVVDDQVTAQKVTWLDLSRGQEFDVEMAAVAWEVKADHVMYLEISATSNDHASSRFPGSVTGQITATFPGIPV